MPREGILVSSSSWISKSDLRVVAGGAEVKLSRVHPLFFFHLRVRVKKEGRGPAVSRCHDHHTHMKSGAPLGLTLGL